MYFSLAKNVFVNLHELWNFYRFVILGLQSGYQINGLITLFLNLKAHLGTEYSYTALDFLFCFCFLLGFKLTWFRLQFRLNSYLAPEFMMHGIVDEKTDVFAFGVLLLELITGRRALDCSQQSLVMWVRLVVYMHLRSQKTRFSWI